MGVLLKNQIFVDPFLIENYNKLFVAPFVEHVKTTTLGKPY